MWTKLCSTCFEVVKICYIHNLDFKRILYTMKGMLKTISIFILSLALLCLYSYCVSHVATGGKRLGFLTDPIRHFSSFPTTVRKVLSSTELRNVPPTYTDKDPSFQQINNLNYDLFGINSFYNFYIKI